jgi:hypothetical protein
MSSAFYSNGAWFSGLIIASRLCRPEYSAFDGAGGLVRAGQWHERGQRVVYAAGSEAIATIQTRAICTLVFPREADYIINPLHPKFGEIAVTSPLQFQFDVSLLGRLH